MNKINFQNGITPLNDTNLNQMQTNIENAIEGLFLRIYPVGSIYMSIDSANPSQLFGGTWVAWGEGRVPVSIDANQTEFNTAEKTGGEKIHTLNINELPTTTFTFSGNNEGNFNASYVGTGGNMISDKINQVSQNNLQPYIACYMWKRVQ